MSIESARVKVVSPLRILFWLLVHPSAWQDWLAKIDPSLPANFSLTELNSTQRRNPLLIRIMIHTWLVQSVLVLIAIYLVQLVIMRDLSTLPLNLAIGLGYALSAGLSGALLSGVATGLVLGFFLGVGVGSLSQQMDAYFLVTSLAAGMAGATLIHLNSPQRRSSILRCILGLLTGLLVAALVITIFWAIVSGELQNTSVPLAIDQNLSAQLLILQVLLGLPIALTLLWIALRLRSSQNGAILLAPAVLLTAWMAIGYIGMVTQPSTSPSMNFTAGMLGGTFIPFLFGMTNTFTSRIGGNNAGAIAAALVAGAGWTALGPHVLSGYEHNPRYMVVSFLILALCLTLSIWRPVVTFPFIAVWNNLLLNLDHNRSSGLRWFRHHAAFWDEKQRFVWPDLDEYLLLLAEREPDQAQAIFARLAVTPQRRAVQRVQIELTARQLEACADIRAIATAHQYTATGLLEGPVSILLSALHSISQDTGRALQQATPYQVRIGLGAVRDRLSLLQNELVISASLAAQRFTPITHQWIQILSSHIESLGAAAQYPQEIPNPYICGMPLNERQSLFVGRSEIIERLGNLLADPRCPPLLLYGQRRMGKTSLLLNLSHFLTSSIVPCFIDCQGLAGYRDSNELLPEFTELVRQAALRYRSLELPPFGHSNEVSVYSKLNQWVNTAEKVLQSRRQTLLLALDEFESLEGVMNAQLDVTRVYLAFARHIVQHHSHFKLLLAGTHLPEEIPLWHDFLINARVLKIDYLTEQETLPLIEKPVSNFPLTYLPGVSQQIYALTRGHPYLVQSLCFELVMLKNEQPLDIRFHVQPEDVQIAAERALASNVFFFNDLFHTQINSDAAEMAISLARCGKHAVIPAQEWQNSFPLTFERGLTDLLRRDLVEPHGDGYRFQIEFMRRWCAAQPFPHQNQSSAS